MERVNSVPVKLVDQNEYWQAVMARDASYDGSFVYAVRSTGIYCRPSCPSRRPGREHVVFFPVPEDAEHAGFRPCRRCGTESVGDDPYLEIVRAACRYIDSCDERPPTLEMIGEHVGTSPHHLHRIFKRIMRITPRQYADARRLDRLKSRLGSGEAIADALYDAGYGSSSRLYERGSEQLGMTPAVYRRGGAGMRIAYTVVGCLLGRLLVAATERGICAVSLGDNDAFLEEGLRKEYPAAEIRREDERLIAWVGALAEHLSGEQPHLDLPLDLQASAFQLRVWEALRAIPYGSTRSYAQIARVIGQPTAPRAVARACATNPASIVIPCHRVVREDGQLGGYRWGLERKEALLATERRSTERREHPSVPGRGREEPGDGE
ncbi:MAG TPA: bifunctional DNA-binding transcriptional regulator/O6-methylguanine-DNA methyltransferase Ada [Ardenticatenaceae bacterium]|nr:bifunctional DNA-binding transcriptional regulator/O6-methylguanine-DNA methyltransferase Ada [Ardenticatenaceae bacterium]